MADHRTRRRTFTDGPGAEEGLGAETSQPTPVASPHQPGHGTYTRMWDVCWLTNKRFHAGALRTPVFVKVDYADEDEHGNEERWSNVVVRFIRPHLGIPKDDMLVLRMVCSERDAVDLDSTGSAVIVGASAHKCPPDVLYQSSWGHCFITDPGNTNENTSIGLAVPVFVDVLFEDNRCTRAVRFVGAEYTDYVRKTFDGSVIDIDGQDIADAGMGAKVRSARAYYDGARCEYPPCFWTGCCSTTDH